MTSNVPMLTDEALRNVIAETFGTDTPPTYYEHKVSRAIEQAVRAQFEARIAMLESEVQARMENEANACNHLVTTIAERDAARAQVARLREALKRGQRALHDLLQDTQHAEHFCGDSGCPVKFAEEVDAELLAALQEQSHE